MILSPLLISLSSLLLLMCSHLSEVHYLSSWAWQVKGPGPRPNPSNPNLEPNPVHIFFFSCPTQSFYSIICCKLFNIFPFFSLHGGLRMDSQLSYNGAVYALRENFLNFLWNSYPCFYCLVGFYVQIVMKWCIQDAQRLEIFNIKSPKYLSFIGMEPFKAPRFHRKETFKIEELMHLTAVLL